MSDQKSDNRKGERELKIIEEYKDVFPEEVSDGLHPLRRIEQQIDLLPGAVLPNRPAYKCSPKETKELRRQVEDFLSKGYVRESLSPCVVPVLLVPKKDVYVVSSQDLQVDQEKVKAIKEWPTPKNTPKVRSFHGLTSFYRRFIKDFSTIASALIDVIKKMNGFKWEEKKEKAFQLLKVRFSNAPLLELPNFDKMLEIECDALSVGIGGLAIQKLMAKLRWSIGPLSNLLVPSLGRIFASGKNSFLTLSLLIIGLDILLLLILLLSMVGKRKAEFFRSIHGKVNSVWVHLWKEDFPSQCKNKLDARGDGPFQVLQYQKTQASIELKLGPMIRA
ncbi:hypothetical protein M9H77_17839 [Catharanthus roseus]|uniref:Uncharacterized protein n=1 Tax=Catharanthus roseus TaxID=4058 RepID=A0ACC0B5R7_CATRO|nr:hypothetical protein M9H77_17839 [Catharanthus roseus]